MAQTTQRLERLRVAALHHVPSGRLGAAIDLDSYEEGRNTGLYAREHDQLPLLIGYSRGNSHSRASTANSTHECHCYQAHSGTQYPSHSPA